MKLRKFYLSYPQDNFLKKISGLSGLSVSEHIRIAIDEYIIKKQREKLNISTSSSINRRETI